MYPSEKRLSPQTVLREIYLSRIIGGLIFDDETARELCRKIDVALPWDGFVSCVISFDEHCAALRGGERGLVNALLDEIYSSTPRFFEPEYRAYIAFNDRYLNCLVNLPESLVSPGSPGGVTAPAVRDIGAVMAALGNAVSGYGQIGVSTGEAKAALDYARLLGLGGPVVYFQEHATPPLSSATIIQTCLEQRIFNCARAGDYEGALTTLPEVAQEC